MKEREKKKRQEKTGEEEEEAAEATREKLYNKSGSDNGIPRAVFVIQINVCDTRWHAAFVLAELSFKRIRRYLCVRTYRIRATLMLLSLGFPYRLFFCFLIPLPVPSPLFFTPRLLSLSLLIVTFTPVDHCARYYACIIGFAGSSNGSEPTRFQ